MQETSDWRTHGWNVMREQRGATYVGSVEMTPEGRPMPLLGCFRTEADIGAGFYEYTASRVCTHKSAGSVAFGGKADIAT